MLTLGAGLLAAGALLFTARNFILSREGQVTDRYTKAIEQLGSDKLDVRIGGIYALERIARDSARDHPVVMEVLTAFIREHSREPRPPTGPGGPEPERSPRPDVQAALTVVGRRDVKRDVRPIDLGRADLAGANLSDADLTGVYLHHATLVGAMLSTRASPTHPCLMRTSTARLLDTDLTGALLDSADLTGAHLVGANLTHAFLGDAIFAGANLTYARWPKGEPVPEGWKRESSGGPRATGTDAEPGEAT